MESFVKVDGGLTSNIETRVRNQDFGCENYGRPNNAQADGKSEGELTSKPVYWSLIEAPLHRLFLLFSSSQRSPVFLQKGIRVL
jgi:hypothetical protein